MNTVTQKPAEKANFQERSDRGITVVAARWRRKPVADAGIIDKYIIKDQLEAAEEAWSGRLPTMH